MPITTLICDFDGVMSGYDVPRRLDLLASMGGISRDEVYGRVWLSGFEDDADAGRYPDPSDYLAEFGERLGVRLTRAQWIEARRAAMQHWPAMHRLVELAAERVQIALLTNNGPLICDAFEELAPHTLKLFGPNLFFSFQFGTKKPDPAIFTAVAEQLGVEPQECLFIDDKPHNARGAREAGMTGVHFAGQSSLEAALAQAGILEAGG